MTLNDEIVAYLTQNKIAFSAGDFTTIQPAGLPEQIAYWNALKLGAVPTAQQLANAAAAQPAIDAHNLLVKQAAALLVKLDANTMPRITVAVALGKTTWAAADVQQFLNERAAVRAIALGTDTVSTTLPIINYPAIT